MKFVPPLPESIALPKRIEMLSGDETIRGTPFQAAYGVVAKYSGTKTAETICTEAGLTETKFNLLKKYSLREFLLFEQAAAKHLATTVGGFDEAVFQIGAAAVDIFFDSVAGRTMKILAGNEPHRMLNAVPNGYELLVNFGHREYVKTGDRSAKFIFRRELLGPVHTSGIFDAAFRQVYNLSLDIQLEATSPVDFVFHLNW